MQTVIVALQAHPARSSYQHPAIHFLTTTNYALYSTYGTARSLPSIPLFSPEPSMYLALALAAVSVMQCNIRNAM